MKLSAKFLSNISIMWLLRNGRQIRVEILEDPCWNDADKWTARNLYVRFMSLGYGKEYSTSLANAGVWKKKWGGTQYPEWLEGALSIKL